MKYSIILLSCIFASVHFIQCSAQAPKQTSEKTHSVSQAKQYKDKLTSEEYHVLFEKGTERPFTGDLLHNKDTGIYVCKACAQPLFHSSSKFDSGTGWPSFDRGCTEGNIERISDRSYGMVREEIICSGCGGHLGHVFNDGPTSTGERFCVNSLSLKFQKDQSPKTP